MKSKPKNGEIVDFLAISWNEPQWEFDYPSCLLNPSISFHTDGVCPDTLIEMAAISLCVGDLPDDNVAEEFDWRGYKIKTLQTVCKARLAGKETWKTKLKEIVKVRLQFYEVDGEMQWREIERIEI